MGFIAFKKGSYNALPFHFFSKTTLFVGILLNIVKAKKAYTGLKVFGTFLLLVIQRKICGFK